MLEQLTGRINNESMAILEDTDLTEHEKFLKLYRHIHDADQVVADCFDDWRRSRMSMSWRCFACMPDFTEDVGPIVAVCTRCTRGAGGSLSSVFVDRIEVVDTGDAPRYNKVITWRLI